MYTQKTNFIKIKNTCKSINNINFIEECECKFKNGFCYISESIIDYQYNKKCTKRTVDTMNSLIGNRYQGHNSEVNIGVFMAEVAARLSKNCGHAERIYVYFINQLAFPSTPIPRYIAGIIQQNASCYLLQPENDINGHDINNFIYQKSKFEIDNGGISVCLDQIPPRFHHPNRSGGVVDYIFALNAYSEIIKKLKSRSNAVSYTLSVDHGDIEEFIDLRMPTFDHTKIHLQNVHICIIISDKFIELAKSNKDINLYDKSTNTIIKSISARSLWFKILDRRLTTGEPFVLFKDNANRNKPEAFKKLNIEIESTNLCTEVLMPTSKDHMGNKRSGLCVLSSMNIDKIEEIKSHKSFIQDMLLFLDSNIDEFVNKHQNDPQYNEVIYSIKRSRHVGLGTYGLHTALQNRNISIESQEAKKFVKETYEYIKSESRKASLYIGERIGHAPDNIDAEIKGRFVACTSIAPNSYSSVIGGDVSAGINLIESNYIHYKDSVNNLFIKNPTLDKIIKNKYANQTEKYEEIWDKIIHHGGSIQNIEEFTTQEKAIFKTSHEIDYKKINELLEIIAKNIDQSVSYNICFGNNTSKSTVHEVTIDAYNKGLNTLYYQKFSNSVDINIECKNCKN